MAIILGTPSKIDKEPPYYPYAKLDTFCLSFSFWIQNGSKQVD